MSITCYLKSRGFTFFEGYSQEVQQQVLDLIKLTDKENINIMEIGFNAGHSAEVFLQNNPTARLTSFDFGSHDYVMPAKEYIDYAFPDRHTLLLGDSKMSIPLFLMSNKGKTFDFIFIDGGHDYETAKADLTNCFKLAHKDTIVVMDDTMYKNEWEHSYNTGPTQVWREFLQENKIIEINKRDYCPGRGMSWGTYVFDK